MIRTVRTGSPLTEGRGLKWHLSAHCNAICKVAPHGGAWIEIPASRPTTSAPRGRPSRRGVD